MSLLFMFGGGGDRIFFSQVIKEKNDSKQMIANCHCLSHKTLFSKNCISQRQDLTTVTSYAPHTLVCSLVVLHMTLALWSKKLVDPPDHYIQRFPGRRHFEQLILFVCFVTCLEEMSSLPGCLRGEPKTKTPGCRCSESPGRGVCEQMLPFLRDCVFYHSFLKTKKSKRKTHVETINVARTV